MTQSLNLKKYLPLLLGALLVSSMPTTTVQARNLSLGQKIFAACIVGTVYRYLTKDPSDKPVRFDLELLIDSIKTQDITTLRKQLFYYWDDIVVGQRKKEQAQLIRNGNDFLLKSIHGRGWCYTLEGHYKILVALGLLFEILGKSEKDIDANQEKITNQIDTLCNLIANTARHATSLDFLT